MKKSKSSTWFCGTCPSKWRLKNHAWKSNLDEVESSGIGTSSSSLELTQNDKNLSRTYSRAKHLFLEAIRPSRGKRPWQWNPNLLNGILWAFLLLRLLGKRTVSEQQLNLLKLFGEGVELAQSWAIKKKIDNLYYPKNSPNTSIATFFLYISERESKEWWQPRWLLSPESKTVFVWLGWVPTSFYVPQTESRFPPRSVGSLVRENQHQIPLLSLKAVYGRWSSNLKIDFQIGSHKNRRICSNQSNPEKLQ